MEDKDKDFTIEEAKQYLTDIKADLFIRNFETLNEDWVITLAKANWAMGLRKGDINEVEFPETLPDFIKDKL